MTIQGPKEYHWTTYKFYCTDCEAPRFASKEAIESCPDGQYDPYADAQERVVVDDQRAKEIVESFEFCLACAYGPEEWAKECSNPEGEKVVETHGLVVAVAETTMDSQEFHNALANLQNAIGVTDGGWASVYDWEEWDTYDSNARCQIVVEYVESERRRTQEGA